MRPTSIPRVSLTRSVLARFNFLHPPLSLSPAESRKFLTLIKDSFRSSLAASTPSVTPTDNHLNRILNTEPFTAGVTTKEDRIQRFLKDPLGVFRQQCLAGKGDEDLAAMCLHRYIRLEREKPKPLKGAPQELKWSPVSFILDGLKNAGIGEPKDVLVNSRLAKAVAEGLVFEGREDIIVRWSKATREEAPLATRQSIVYYGVQNVKELYGWERAAALFRDVLAGVRSKDMFLKRYFSSTGLMLCESGMNEGFGESIMYKRLVDKCSVWGTRWQMQAWVCLKYAKRVDVGVNYFWSFVNSPDGVHRGPKNAFWYHQDTEFPLKLVEECLAQGKFEEAEMIKEVVEKKFVGKVSEESLDSIRRLIEAGRAETGVAKNEDCKSDHSLDLQGVLNAPG